jgi:oligoribonuclease (3'-5' exoribonuclease)
MADESTFDPYALMFCDLEATGLDPREDSILELSYELTTFAYPFLPPVVGAYLPLADTLLVTEGAEDMADHLITDEVTGKVIDVRKSVNGQPFVHPTVVEMHEKNGLFVALRKGPTLTLAAIEAQLLNLSADWPLDKDRKVRLAGNSVHFDLSFLRVHIPTFAKRLSHQVFDVSATLLACRAAGMPAPPKPEEAHRARADVERSLATARMLSEWMRRGT